MLVTRDENLKAYIDNILKQLHAWLMEGKVSKLVLVIEGLESKKTLERWQFVVEKDEGSGTRSGKASAAGKKSKKEITKEIQAVIRQITASVTFLPLIEEPCAFDMLVYADDDAQVPVTWEETDQRLMKNQTEVKLRSFSTNVHKIDAMVAYNADTEEDDDDDV